MTQSNIIQEIEEDLQRQRIEKLWNKYGVYVIGAAVAVVVLTAGIVGWKKYRTGVEERTTAGFVDIIENKGLGSEAKVDALKLFAQNNKGESPSALAMLQAAAISIDGGEKDKALAIYDDLSKDKTVDRVFSSLADLMAVQLMMDSGDPKILQERLKPLLADDGPWHNLAREYSAHLSLKAGNKEEAKKLFLQLSQDKVAPTAISRRAADMLKFLEAENR